MDDTQLFETTRTIVSTFTTNKQFDRSEQRLSVKEKISSYKGKMVRVFHTENVMLDMMFQALPFDSEITDAAFSMYRLSKDDRELAKSTIHEFFTYGYCCDCCGNIVEKPDNKIHFSVNEFELDDTLCSVCSSNLNNQVNKEDEYSTSALLAL